MSQASWDAIIVGQGLAGTTLAWHLSEAGCKVLILDACEPVTSSKIAAGLITPITGKRLAPGWNYDKFFTTAKNFYRRIEQRTHQEFFFHRTAIRLFKSNDERHTWSRRENDQDAQLYVQNPAPSPLIDPEIADPNHSGFAMDAAQLDVNRYLDVSRTVLNTEETKVDWTTDVELRDNQITICKHKANYVISCEGFAAIQNPYFSNISFKAAKGDILTVRFEKPLPPLCIHKGIWLAPTHDARVFNVGSSYDWENLNQTPSAKAGASIQRKLDELVRIPYTVINHRAAVRPIIDESKPVIARHTIHKRLGIFNGLGSKGSLLAPWFAERFAQFLIHQTPLPEENNPQNIS